MKLIKIDSTIPRDIRYKTTNNFTGTIVYGPLAECYLIDAAAQAIAQVHHELKRQNLSLKIFDAYRPLSIQKIFWKLVPDERYVANPTVGSRHNRGCAIDVTLIDLQTRREIDMGTDFDDFTHKAHRNYKNLAPTVLTHRELLERVMNRHNFEGWLNEWWHFDFMGWQNYPVSNQSFEELHTIKET